MSQRSTGEMRMEQAEYQREQDRLQDGTRCEGTRGCMGSQDHTIPDDVDSTHAGSQVCDFHYQTIMGRLMHPNGDELAPRERAEWWAEQEGNDA